VRRFAKSILLLLLLALLAAIVDGWRGFGKTIVSGERRARMERSPEWRDGRFRNPQPLVNDAWGSIVAMFTVSADVRPAGAVPIAAALVDPPPPASVVAVTWYGHSSALLELDGERVLVDPVWSERAGPFSWVGPERWYPPPVPLEALRGVSAVIISHDHYDHLDRRTVTAMKDWPTRFVVPLGLGAHLAYWGVPEEKIVELDWWERTRAGGVEIVCTPARHAAGRVGLDYDGKLWSGFALLGREHRVYYSGDTGLFTAQKEIGARLGPFDLTLIEVGQYNAAWPDWHIGPEQAVLAHQWVRGGVFLPVHWGAFALAAHAWTEPIERALAEAEKQHVQIVTPRPGERVDATKPPPPERWWPNVAWQRAEEAPIVSGAVER
jgi:L-ascorbate metabolism protein UlaG (beta-lactamase superfamily)